MVYWCHVCKQEVSATETDAELLCAECQSPFVEEIEATEDHPRNFVPYRPASSIANILTDLILSPAVRSIRYLAAGNRAGLQGVPDTSLDQIIHQIMMNDPNRYGPPPASQHSLSNLPKVIITPHTVQHLGTYITPVDECGEKIGEPRRVLDCSVCKDEFGVGEEATQMPCEHIFHQDCLLPWLKQHNSCPVCRYELPTDDPDYEQRRRVNTM